MQRPIVLRHIRLVLASDSPYAREEFEETVTTGAQFELAGTCSWREVLPCCERLRPDLVVLDGSVEPAIGWTGIVRRLRELDQDSKIALLLGGAEGEESVEELDAVLSAEFGITAILEALQVLVSGAVVSVGPRPAVPHDDDLVSYYDARERVSALTSREREILLLITDGLSNRAVSSRLRISPDTVKEHVSRILGKLEVASRLEAAVVAVRAEFG
ncbi:LuxR C-terminal-related transcriptional regulator [Nocardia sp. NPDC101769]|uniref:LuxR C-terminal-related transcriptional regulator n=1 Tax=Nocardia sp. NPDC101769 TaxID=3364333 RepID=UPI0038065886